jgi:hypothetical protein
MRLYQACGEVEKSYCMALEMNKEENTFLPFGFYHSQPFYHSCLLQFNIIPLTIETDNCVGPNRREGKGAMNSDHKARETNSIHQSIKKTVPEASWFLKGREFGTVYVTLIQTRVKFKRPECKLGLLACPISRYITPNCISQDQLTLKRKSRAMRRVTLL